MRDLSVLIATRNRAASLARALASMVDARRDDVDWELCVVDNGSSDDTPDVLARYAAVLPLRWMHVAEPGQNRARNRMIATLDSRLTILTDDDVVVAGDWLQQWRDALRRWPDTTIFGGRIEPAFPDGTPGWISAADFPFRGQCFAAFAPRCGEGRYDGEPFGPNFAVTTALLKRERFREDLGPSSSSYAVGGETELVSRLRRQGHHVVYLPQPRVQHCLIADNLTVDKLLQRGFNAGRGDEFRRAMRAGWGPVRLWWRARLFLPLKIALYRALARPAEAPLQGARFRRVYKYHAARGRRHQLLLMLEAGRSAKPAPSTA